MKDCEVCTCQSKAAWPFLWDFRRAAYEQSDAAS